METGGWHRDRIETLCALAKAASDAQDRIGATEAVAQARAAANALGTSLDPRLYKLIATTAAALS